MLIVDDNEYNLFVLQNYLKSVHLAADEALNGKEAVEKVVSRATDNVCCRGYKVVVMDINMPIMDGIEATKLLRLKMKEEEVPETPIVALSAQPLKDEDKEYCYHEVGFVEYLSKPINKSEFVRVMKKYLTV